MGSTGMEVKEQFSAARMWVRRWRWRGSCIFFFFFYKTRGDRLGRSGGILERERKGDGERDVTEYKIPLSDHCPHFSYPLPFRPPPYTLSTGRK